MGGGERERREGKEVARPGGSPLAAAAAVGFVAVPTPCMWGDDGGDPGPKVDMGVVCPADPAAPGGTG